jgi:hypothetical protein
MATLDPLLDTHDAAAWLRCGEPLVRELIKTEGLPARELAGQFLIDPDELRAWFLARPTVGGAPAPTVHAAEDRDGVEQVRRVSGRQRGGRRAD